jgi:mRNA-degrading endonuclease RelE of RelBE toxin-antitoxin system
MELVSNTQDIEIRFTAPFKQRLKVLAKRFRQVQKDIFPILSELQVGNFIGDQIKGTDLIVFKVRAKNSDIPTGKSGGYRLIYQVFSDRCVLLLLIYAKSDQADVDANEILEAIEGEHLTFAMSNYT